MMSSSYFGTRDTPINLGVVVVPQRKNASLGLEQPSAKMQPLTASLRSTLSTN
jgi:hypothetical protein